MLRNSRTTFATYSNTAKNVRQIARDGGNWAYYDNEFRKLRQAIMVPWGYVSYGTRPQGPFTPRRGALAFPAPPGPTGILFVANRPTPPSDPLPPPTPRAPASNTTPLKSAVRHLVTSPTPCYKCEGAHTSIPLPERAVTRAALRENPPPLPPRPSHGPQPLGPPAQAQLPTPVNPTKLAEILHGYERHTAEYLVNGFSKGFSIGFEGPQRQIISPNLSSAIQNPSHSGGKNFQRTRTRQAGRNPSIPRLFPIWWFPP